MTWTATARTETSTRPATTAARTTAVDALMTTSVAAIRQIVISLGSFVSNIS